VKRGTVLIRRTKPLRGRNKGWCDAPFFLKGSIEGNQGGGGSRDPWVEFEADPKDRKASEARRGQRGHPQIERSTF
jgi:hypothetical protein